MFYDEYTSVITHELIDIAKNKIQQEYFGILPAVFEPLSLKIYKMEQIVDFVYKYGGVGTDTKAFVEFWEDSKYLSDDLFLSKFNEFNINIERAHADIKQRIITSMENLGIQYGEVYDLNIIALHKNITYKNAIIMEVADENSLSNMAKVFKQLSFVVRNKSVFGLFQTKNFKEYYLTSSIMDDK